MAFNIKPRNLSALPVELLQHIASFLSPSSTACLALSCRRIYADIDRRPFYKLKEREEEMREYIELLYHLSQDATTNMRQCDYCLTLHEREEIENEPQDLGEDTTDLPSSEFEDDDSWLISNDEPLQNNYEALHEIPLYRSMLFQPFNHEDVALRRRLCAFRPLGMPLTLPKTVLSFPDLTATYHRAGTARFGPGDSFSQEVWVKVILSVPLVSESGSSNLARALRPLDMHCCVHCPKGCLDKEVVCKTEQLVHLKDGQASTSGCECVQKQPYSHCRHHDHGRKCECVSDVTAHVLGNCAIEVYIWRWWGDLGKPAHYRTRSGLARLMATNQ